MVGAKQKTVHVLSVIPRLSQTLREKLTDVDVVEVKMIGDASMMCHKKVDEEGVVALKEAEVLLVDNTFLTQIKDQLPKLQWAQGTWAGVEGLISHFKDKPKPTFPITRMVGENFSQLMAEYTVGWIISHERGWLKCKENQDKCEWVTEGNIESYRSLRDLTVGVLGLGNIGKEVARSLKAFNCTVHAYARSLPPVDKRTNNVDKYWCTGELQMFLKQCDYLVNIMPSTDKTRGMLGGETLKDAKKNAVLINIGRGDVIREADLIKALDSGWISAAIIDVFTEEPLAKENPLWKHPKVVITPHTAGASTARDVIDTFIANFRRYSQGLPVMYVIDWDVGY
ncbi:glyoxylate/hydroxypyruvate reductase A-like isoform X4 [Panulirus ornatus]|uniref:glyoxylate/hydroxypyruvate reductase A-like isoform X4 n=1 Tax=Panulirus ornatus TaxID=150431 RepID=UPI003A836DFC